MSRSASGNIDDGFLVKTIYLLCREQREADRSKKKKLRLNRGTKEHPNKGNRLTLRGELTQYHTAMLLSAKDEGRCENNAEAVKQNTRGKRTKLFANTWGIIY